MSRTEHAVSSWIYPHSVGSLNGFLSVIDVTSCLRPQDWGALIPAHNSSPAAVCLSCRVSQGYLFLPEAQEYFPNSWWSFWSMCAAGWDVLLLWLPASVEEGLSPRTMEKCCSLPNAMSSSSDGSWVSSEGKSVYTSGGLSNGSGLSCSNVC